MEPFLEILKYTLPSALLLVGMYFIFRQFTVQAKDKYKYEMFIGNQKTVTPLRLQAYERLILFLERTRFESLILRNLPQSSTAKQLQRAIMNDIRNEFSHNLSQQLYVSTQAWTAVSAAKEQMIRMLNLLPTPETVTTTQFSQALIENYNQNETQPIDTAIEILKEEARNNFGM